MRITPALFVLLFAAAPALAQSNMGMAQYPAPKCAVPPAVDAAQRPKPPANDADELEVVAYNSKVRGYNAAMRAHNDGMKTYAACVDVYVAAAKADINRIQMAVDAAVAAANAQNN